MNIYILQAVKVVLDAKTNYPAACNAMETLLIHQSLLDCDVFYQVALCCPLPPPHPPVPPRLR